jgi:hypothetical protein
MLRVDSIVLPMRAYEANVDYPIGIIDPDYDAIFVSADIEDHSTVLKDAGAADIALHSRRIWPIRPLYLPIPRHQRFIGISVGSAPTQEPLERA